MGDVFSRQPFLRAGVFLGRTTKAADLQALVRTLRIMPIDRPLIRVGPASDGGYLLPDDLEEIQHCFSPGVAGCSDFEVQLANRGMQAYLADRSVDGPAAPHPNFRFIKKFLASTDDPADGLMTLDTWYRTEVGPVSATSPEAVLQMDIEGAEYEVLLNTPDALLNRFRILVIEFHRLHQLAERQSFQWMSCAFRKLLRNHAVVHAHPNNHRRILNCGGVQIPGVLEMTFLRRDRFRPGTAPVVIPHPLDAINVPSRPEVPLPACWYR